MKPQLLLTATLLMVSCADSVDVSKTAKPEIKEPTPEPVEKKVKPAAVKKGEITEVNIEQVFEMKTQGKALLIDTRPSIFFALGHIDGAENFPLKEFSDIKNALYISVKQAQGAGKTVIIYCANLHCPDSRKMAVKLADQGYDVSVFKEGWELWKEAGLD